MNEEKTQRKQWRILFTPRGTVIWLYCIGSLMLFFGILFKVLNSTFPIYHIDYDNCIIQDQANCLVTFHVTQQMKGQIILLYSLSNFYQNHRSMITSVSYKQLKGDYLPYDELQACSPNISIDNSKDPKKLYLPCGLLATTFFNDSYYWMNDSIAHFSEENIALKSDKNKVFKPISDKYVQGYHWLENYTAFPGSTENEHFILWMRAAAMPNFIKIYSICEDCSIPPGDYTISISMAYPKTQYSGKRTLILAENSFIGSSSKFIGDAYLSVGVIALFFATIFFLHMLICPRQFGDLSSIWKVNNQTFVPFSTKQQSIENQSNSDYMDLTPDFGNDFSSESPSLELTSISEEVNNSPIENNHKEN